MKKPRKQRRRPDGKTPWREVMEDARARGVSQAQVAREQGVSRCAVHKQCRRFGVVLPLDRSRASTTKVTRDVLKEALEAGLRAREVATALGVTPPAVVKAQARHGIYLRGARNPQAKGR